MKLQILDKDCSDRLNNRLADELYASYFYRSASNYCRMVGFEGGAKFFHEESEQELTHAKRLEDYITDWNCLPDLKNIQKPVTFTGLPDIINQSYQLELNLYDAYNTDALAILDEESGLFTFLQEFMKIQDESVREYSTYVNQLEIIGSDKFALYYWDKEVLGK